MTFEQFIEFMNQPLFHIANTPVTLGGIGAALTVFFGALIVSSILQKIVSSRMGKNPKFTSGMTYALQRILHYAMVLLGVFLAAQCIGLNLGSLAVVFGFLGVGIGLGLQNITSNFVAGIILLIERPVAIGDFVNVDGEIGEVKHINMRATEIMTIDNISMIVPNTKFVENTVTNWSLKDPRVRVHCKVGVAYGSDLKKVKASLFEVAEAHEDVLDDPAPEVRFLEFDNSSLNFDLLIWIQNPRKQFVVRSEINFMIDDIFQKNGIRIPFPQRDLHLQMSDAVKELADADKS